MFGPLIRDKNCMYDQVEEEGDLSEQDLDEILAEFENEFDHDLVDDLQVDDLDDYSWKVPKLILFNRDSHNYKTIKQLINTLLHL